jgi:hypothetical protein
VSTLTRGFRAALCTAAALFILPAASARAATDPTTDNAIVDAATTADTASTVDTAAGADAAEPMQAAPAPQATWPPQQYQDRRFMEDWTPPDWSNPHQGARDWFDDIKAVKLNDSGSVWVGFGGQARGRLARQSTVTFGGPFDFEPTMWTWRFKGYGDLHFGKHFRAYAEGLYSHSSINEARLGVSAGAPNLNGDVLNAFGEYKGNLRQGLELGLWGGRRELQFGHERMVSPGNWLLNEHTYDGGGMWLASGERRLELFLVRPRIPVPDMFSRKDDDTTFWGAEYSTTATRRPDLVFGDIKVQGRPQRVTFQPYVLGINRKNVTFVQGTADEHRYTFGGLAFGDLGATGFDFEVEAMYQYGKYNTGYDKGNIQAYSSTTELGFRFNKAPLYPRVIASFDYASGDKDQNDAKLGTFDPLYPLAYVFFGFHAAFERKNLVVPGAHVELLLHRNTYFRANYLPAMLRAQTADGVYNSFGDITRRPEPQSKGGDTIDLQTASRNIGQQVDFGVAWLPTHHLLFYGTYLRFWPGQFYNDTQTAPVDPMNGVMVLTQFNF